MKKGAAFISILCCAALLSSCTEKCGLSNGMYVAQDIMGTYIEFDSEHETFMLVHNGASSHIPGGQFECAGGKVFATEDLGADGTNTYVFEIIDEKTIRFLESESAEVSFYVPPGGTLEFALSE